MGEITRAADINVPLREMKPGVIPFSHELEILNGVVAEISINVVDEVAVRDWPVPVFPDFLMESLPAELGVADMRSVIVPVRRLLGVGIAAKFDPLEKD